MEKESRVKSPVDLKSCLENLGWGGQAPRFSKLSNAAPHRARPWPALLLESELGIVERELQPLPSSPLLTTCLLCKPISPQSHASLLLSY